MMNTLISMVLLIALLLCMGICLGLLIAEHQYKKYEAYKRENHGRIAPMPKYKIPVPPIGAKRK